MLLQKYSYILYPQTPWGYQQAEESATAATHMRRAHKGVLQRIFLATNIQSQSKTMYYEALCRQLETGVAKSKTLWDALARYAILVLSLVCLQNLRCNPKLLPFIA